MDQTELRQEITAKIVQAMQNGVPPWRQPYRSDPNSGFPTNVLSKQRYQGVNLLLLQATALDRKYLSMWWGTYEQWGKMGAQVKKRPDSFEKGEWGTRIVFYRQVRKDEDEIEADDKKNYFFVLKSFWLFNVDQVEGEHLSMFRCNPDSLEDRFLAKLNYDHVDEVVEATKVKITWADKPAYNAEKDKIELPKKSRFVDLRSYYSCLFNQLVHWTEKRLDWPGKLRMKPDEREAMSELIAEIGACYLEAELKIPHCEDMTNHNAYLQRWLAVLNGNPRRIFDASSQAVKAVDYILQFSRECL